MTTPTPSAGAQAPVPQAKPTNEGKKLPDVSDIKGLVPTNFGEAKQISQYLAASDLVPREMKGKPANVLLAIMYGLEIGINPAQALQNIMVVNGRPALWGDAVMGKVLGSRLCATFKDWSDDKDGGTHYFMAKRADSGVEITRSFSQAEAKAAGLANKQGPWTQYPARMRFHRARSWCLRDLFPDVLKGVSYAEEAMDIPVKDAVTGVPMPKRESDAVREAAVTAEVTPEAEMAPMANAEPAEQPTEEPQVQPEKAPVPAPMPAPAQNEPTADAPTAPDGIGHQEAKAQLDRVAKTSLNNKVVYVLKTKGEKSGYYTDNEDVAKFGKEYSSKGAPAVKIAFETVDGRRWVNTIEKA